MRRESTLKLECFWPLVSLSGEEEDVCTEGDMKGDEKADVSFVADVKADDEEEEVVGCSVEDEVGEAIGDVGAGDVDDVGDFGGVVAAGTKRSGSNLMMSQTFITI